MLRSGGGRPSGRARSRSPSRARARPRRRERAGTRRDTRGRDPPCARGAARRRSGARRRGGRRSRRCRPGSCRRSRAPKRRAARASGSSSRGSRARCTSAGRPLRSARSRRLHMIGLVAALPGNAEVADQFDLLADLLELEGAESFRVLAYRRAATRMRETSGSVAQLALDGRAKELQGIGKTIEEKIVQIVEQGEIEALTKRKNTIPPEVVLFMRLPGLGPKTAARIWKELGISTLVDLKAAAEAEGLRSLAGLGPKSEEKILKALAFQAENPDEGRRLLGEGLPAVQAVVAVLREHPSAVHVSEAGSVRRRKETFRDLDIIATATDPAELTAYFTQLPWVVEVVAHGD